MSNKLGPALKRRPQITPASYRDLYSNFDQLNGEHPWMQKMPDGFVAYNVRELRQGDVTYFNYALAKEMGLLPADHPQTLTASLRNKLLQTFSIRIINEYDIEQKTKFDLSTIKPNKYMASRYLQLQHTDKRGLRSGDGRCVWNGVVSHLGKVWDVSSRGTGVTCLSPGSANANKNLKTGGTQFGYGCGLAEIDELYGAAIFAEIMHLQGIPTERVLAIVDFGDGTGIGVRAGQNLLRPAHLFRYLKQDRREDLAAGVDYFYHRQRVNGRLKTVPVAQRYAQMLGSLSESYAQFAANLEVNYIFAWLDWDGDNVLMDAGIIDYGSIRQFGMRHDKYRYDDVERFSTNLNEQKDKARLIVQVFAQMFDYLQTGKRKPLNDFRQHRSVQSFNSTFATALLDSLLYRCGFNPAQRKVLLLNKRLVHKFFREFSYFERAKVSGTIRKVADGVNLPALFNMRPLLHALPEQWMKSGVELSDSQFFDLILSGFAKARDAKMRPKHQEHIRNFQRVYKQMLTAAGCDKPAALSDLAARARELNNGPRITGNALIQIVNELVLQIKRGLTASEIQKLIDQVIFTQLGRPEVKASEFYSRRPRAISKPEIFEHFLELIEEHKEDI